MRRILVLLLVLLMLSALLATVPVAAVPAPPASGSPADTTPAIVFLPLAFGPPPLPAVQWDPRLDQRGTTLIAADVEPGQGYWRLVKGAWYAVGEEFNGQHNIFMDALDAAGRRQPGVPIDVTSLDQSTRWDTVVTELKPGEPYATNFPMYNLAPSYRAMPADGNPADAVSGMGMGSIEYPWRADHTNYGFVWQWTIAPDRDPTPQPSPTPEATATP